MTMTNNEFQSVREGRTFISERISRLDPSREQIILKAAKTLSHELSVTLQYNWETEQQVELTEAGVCSWLAQLDEFNKLGKDYIYGLRNHPSEPTVLFYWQQTPSRCPEREKVQCTIPDEISLESLLRIFSEISPYFQAVHSYMYNLTLQNLHGRAMRKYEIAIARRPPEDHQYILKPNPYKGVIDILPPLLLSHEFNRVCVPDGVSWVNYWSPLQVETVGMDRIKATDWARMIELKNGGVILAITENPFDVTNADHMAQLSSIVTHLRLRKIQEKHRLNFN